jgi:hypothetical protein
MNKIGRMGEETFAAFDAERLAPDRCGRQPSPRALARAGAFGRLNAGPTAYSTAPWVLL